MFIKNDHQALSYLNQTIPNSTHKFPGQSGLKRLTYLLNLLDNPQNKYQIIHIAGTSGKGSVALYLSQLLVAHGFKVGLTISPHLFDIRERIQINNKLISKKDFITLLNSVLPAINKTKQDGFGQPTFYEIMTTMFYLFFAKAHVNYAVIETGLGGLLDSTNVVSSPNKLAIITKLGLDHTKVLGRTITDIAFQKAGIIKPQNTVICLKPTPKAKKVIDSVSTKNKAILTYISSPKNFSNITLNNDAITYNFSFQNFSLPIRLNTLAFYQVENSALALSALTVLGQTTVNPIKINQVFNTYSPPARFEMLSLGQSTIIFDGAHNPQKMSAFIKSLKSSYPHQKFVFIVAFKQKTQSKKMLEIISPIASQIIQTTFDQDQLNQVLKLALSQTKYIAITGSLHLRQIINI